ncbi:HAD family hydrolase [Streptomyces roseolus]|uniref:HAD family hydrolase n=1 Tax=Streptomyces roseolus TaxID=67358 RepID=UPI003628BB88
MTTDAPAAPRPLVIFDLDGVLVDTQDAENGALAHVGELMGLTLGREERDALFSGKKMQECLDLMEELTGTAPPANATALARARCEELIGDRMDPVDGAVPALRALTATGLTLCVASNSPREIIERRLDKAGILHPFGGRLFSAYDVSAWKPDPGLFLWAAAECGTDPAACLVVEDSAVGVDAALGAGMPVLQYTPDPGTGPHRPGARLLPSLHDLPDLVRHHFASTPHPVRPGGRS